MQARALRMLLRGQLSQVQTTDLDSPIMRRVHATEWVLRPRGILIYGASRPFVVMSVDSCSRLLLAELKELGAYFQNENLANSPRFSPALTPTSHRRL